MGKPRRLQHTVAINRVAVFLEALGAVFTEA
jgi:hypothetical protein